MYFDIRTFLRQKLYAATHGAGDGPWLLTAAQLVLYPLVHLCFGLDELVHPEIAVTPVRSPLFIVSSPRSGSTLLLHLLAADPAIACHHLREMICPSPTLRTALPARVEAWADRVFQSRFAGLESIHPLRFSQPEEDEILFLILGEQRNHVVPVSVRRRARRSGGRPLLGMARAEAGSIRALLPSLRPAAPVGTAIDLLCRQESPFFGQDRRSSALVSRRALHLPRPLAA